MARLFVAVWPPEEVVARLAALPRPDQPGVRWTTRDQWHVTLRFLGEADPADAAGRLARAVLEPAAARLGPRVGTLGAEIVAVPVAGLDDLAAAADAVLDDPPDRRFRGHVTLARVRRGRRRPDAGRRAVRRRVPRRRGHPGGEHAVAARCPLRRHRPVGRSGGLGLASPA